MFSSMTDFLDNAHAAISKHRMLRSGDRVLVAVSGGPDSLALLSALVALRSVLRIQLRAAYVDHGLRPAAARREAALVRRLGKEWGVPVTVLRRTVRKGKKDSPESSAREARYQALASLARRLHCASIATGHTADDQAETVLMRIFRGAGTTGLTGIPPVRYISHPGPLPRGERVKGEGIRIIRPLLSCTRDQVIGYLRARRIRPLLDRSNLSDRFLRNRIRHRLISQLEREFNPQVRRHLCQLAELVREDLDWLTDEAGRRFRQVARVRQGKIRLQRALLRKELPALRKAVLRLAAARLQGDGQGFALRHWEMLDQLLLAQKPGAVDLPHRFRAVAQDGVLILSRAC